MHTAGNMYPNLIDFYEKKIEPKRALLDMATISAANESCRK